MSKRLAVLMAVLILLTLAGAAGAQTDEELVGFARATRGLDLVGRLADPPSGWPMSEEAGIVPPSPEAAGAELPSGVQPGVGWPVMDGALVVFAFGGNPPLASCPRGSRRRLAPQFDPWRAAGVPYTTHWPLVGTPAAMAFAHGFNRMFGETAAETERARVDRPGGIGYCVGGGFAGGAPHCVGAANNLREWYVAQPAAHQDLWDGVPNRLEVAVMCNSEGEWCRLLAALGKQCGGIPGGCGNGWHCEPLISVPEAYRVGAPAPSERDPGRLVKARADSSSAPSEACWYPGHAATYGALYVRERPSCFAGLRPECRSAATLTAACWDTTAEPTCGDGLCVAPETWQGCPTDCPRPVVCGDGACDSPEGPGSCPADCPLEPPPAERLVVQLDRCDGSGWTGRWIVLGRPGAVIEPWTTTAPGKFIASTGRTPLELVEVRTPACPATACPPPPDCPPPRVCPDPPPCGEPDPDPEPRWSTTSARNSERRRTAPAGDRG